MSPEVRKFLLHWGRRRRNGDGEVEPPSARKLQRLHDTMQDKASVVDHNTATFVQAALEYGVELTRSEYRPLANRNWKTIQKFGVKVMRMLAVLTVVLLFLGWQTLNTTNDIQHDRRNSVLQKCEAGEHFDTKLRAGIAKLPEPQKAQQLASLSSTEELVSTVVPIEHDHCRKALELAGLTP